MFQALRLTLAVWLLAGQGPAAGTAIPPRIATFLRESEELRRGTIVQLEQQLRRISSQPNSSPEVQKQRARLAADLERLRSPSEPLVPQLKYPPSVGAIGRLPRASGYVEQVLSPTRMLIRCDFTLQVRTVRNFRPRYETITRPVLLLVEDLSTDRAGEGADLQLDGVFEIVRTQQYVTVSGRKQQAWVLKPFDLRTVQPYFQPVSGRR